MHVALILTYPAFIPVTVPPLTVAIVGLELLQVTVRPVGEVVAVKYKLLPSTIVSIDAEIVILGVYVNVIYGLYDALEYSVARKLR